MIKPEHVEAEIDGILGAIRARVRAGTPEKDLLLLVHPSLYHAITAQLHFRPRLELPPNQFAAVEFRTENVEGWLLVSKSEREGKTWD